MVFDMPAALLVGAQFMYQAASQGSQVSGSFTFNGGNQRVDIFIQPTTGTQFRVILQNPESVPMNERVYIVAGTVNLLFISDTTGQIVIDQSTGILPGMPVQIIMNDSLIYQDMVFNTAFTAATNQMYVQVMKRTTV